MTTVVTSAWHPADLNPLSDETLAQLDGSFRLKPRLLGRCGTTAGLNFIYAHLNRVIKERGQSTVCLTGPGHGGPGLVWRGIPVDQLRTLMVGYGHNAYFCEVKEGADTQDTADAHRRFALLLDTVVNEISEIKANAASGDEERPRWPMIIFGTPKGWRGPDFVDRKKTTGSAVSHCRFKSFS